MLNLRYCVFLEAVRPRHDEGAQRMRALDMGIVIDLDAPGRRSRPNTSATPSSNCAWALFSAMRRPSCSRALVKRALHDLALLAPLRRGDFDLDARRAGSSASASRVAVRQFFRREQDQSGRGALVVELADESFQHSRPVACRGHGAGSKAGCPSSVRRGRRTPVCRSDRPRDRRRTDRPPRRSTD